MPLPAETIQISLDAGVLVTLLGMFLRNGKSHAKEHVQTMAALERVADKVGEVVDNTKGLNASIALVQDHLDAHDTWEREERATAREQLTKHDDTSRVDRERVREALNGHDQREVDARNETRGLIREIHGVVMQLWKGRRK